MNLLLVSVAVLLCSASCKVQKRETQNNGDQDFDGQDQGN